MKQVLEVDGVILEFGRHRVLQDVYLKCETGQVTGLIGRNGTGKTCLMNIIYGKLKPTYQSVRINRKVYLKPYRKPSEMMYLPQYNFIPRSLSLKRIFKDLKIDFSEFTNIFPTFKKYYRSNLKKLSTGEQRIIEIYTILTSDTQFCMLDEPFSQVMPVHIESIKRLINKEKKKKGLLITDHLYKHIVEICDTIYLIANQKTYLTTSISDIEMLGYITKSDN